MSRDTLHIMRTLVALFLFQFVSPTVLSVVASGASTMDDLAAWAPIHSSITSPVFLKEQEERDHEELSMRTFDAPFITDLSNHSRTHIACQSLVYKGYYYHKLACAAPLFELHCSYLI